MGGLQRFEKRLSGIVEGGFARVFRGRVEPVELASALAREADTNKAVGPQRVLVPNVYAIALGRADFERLAPYALTLGDELALMVSEHAAEQGYTFVGPVAVTLHQQDTLSTGAFRIESRVEAARDAPSRPAPAAPVERPVPTPRAEPVFPPARTPDGDFPNGPLVGQAPVPPLVTPPLVTPPLVTPPDPTPTVPPLPETSADPTPEPEPVAYEPPAEPPAAQDPALTTVFPAAPPPPPARGRLQLPDGQQVSLTADVTVIGRGADADIRIRDASVSRRHAAISVVGRAVIVEDLNSTNGVLLDGRKISRDTLTDGAELRLGAAIVRYWA
jgi:pSer/pThr/pTyr-binding forkhead associated (FHA) protein